MDKRIIVPEKTKLGLVWGKLLHEWLELINLYTSNPDDERPDVPYWYGERALTGLLSAAAWRLEDGWALEEFTALRGRETERGSGRGDLWLGVGDTVLTIEAKIHWPERDVSSAIQGIKEKLEVARKQLRNLAPDYQQGIAFSICYVVPWPRINSADSASRNAVALLDQVAEKFAAKNCMVAKYSFRSSPPEDAGRVYPGVALVAREEMWKG